MDGVSFVVVSLAVGYITCTLTYSSIAAGFRAWVDSWALNDNKTIKKMSRHFARMLACPFCSGFWVAGIIQAIFRFNAIGYKWLGVVVITWPALALAGAFLAFAAGHAMNHLPKSLEYR